MSSEEPTTSYNQVGFCGRHFDVSQVKVRTEGRVKALSRVAVDRIGVRGQMYRE
jgi:hypothetical protein